MVAATSPEPPIARPPARSGSRAAERSTGDKVRMGVSLVGKVLVSALWAAGGAVAASTGEWAAVGVVAVYLGYLWVFNGRWLIY